MYCSVAAKNRYVDNPAGKLLAILQDDGKLPEILTGKIVAGDAVELQVVDILPKHERLIRKMMPNDAGTLPAHRWVDLWIG